MKSIFQKLFKIAGPGFLVAATGVGAGDIIAATNAGADYGIAIAWAVLVGAVLKYALNEGLARWQLATGLTLFEGWVKFFGKWVQYYFFTYLFFWSFFVGAALMSACGLAGNALFPQFSIATWAIIHSLLGVFFVSFGGYAYFEKIMGGFTGVMFIAFIGCAFYISPPHTAIWASITKMSIPAGSGPALMSVIGGVGGSVTLLSYGYWIKEKNWNSPEQIKTVRLDLFMGYALTGLFGFALVILASDTLFVKGLNFQKEGGHKIIQMALMLQNQLGNFGYYLFLLGFWAAVATSLFGVWQSVPTLFCDFVSVAKNLNETEREKILEPSSSLWYKGYLLYLALGPIPLVIMNDKPFYIIVFYTIIGSFFMPFLAGTLLIMNSKTAWIGEKYRYSFLAQLFLVFCLLLFGYLCMDEINKTYIKYFVEKN